MEIRKYPRETRRKGNTKFHIPPFKIHLFRHLQYHIYVQCPCCVSMAPKNELADSLSCSLSVGTSASLCVTSSLCRFTIYTTRPPVHVSSTSYFKFDGGSSTSTHLTASVHFKGLHSAMRSSCTFAETSVNPAFFAAITLSRNTSAMSISRLGRWWASKLGKEKAERKEAW